ncbi:thiamine phosphate synthase [uncultured Roseovarius sp.]|uniref:thiamine phosphate synthase n=1 Tax=uncultured Roseovarius sp. TaxID=293344 RepID=UPI0025D725C3|nr:thiamine phosphate synthase [uncultured Roseovarius sp.]
MIGPVYFITDPGAPLSVEEQAMAAARGGAAVVQLRDKHASDDEMLELARRLRGALPGDVKLVINDRVDVAVWSGCDGLHIGQGDGDVVAIRKRLGPDRILGLSIETESQVASIPTGYVDYIGVGPVRATATKPDHAAPIGFDGLARIIGAAGLPAVAIGGIGPGDAGQVKLAGAEGVAVVSAISRAEDPEAAAHGLLEEWGQA